MKKRPAKKEPAAKTKRRATKKPKTKRPAKRKATPQQSDDLKELASQFDSLEGIHVEPAKPGDRSLRFTVLRDTDPQEDWWTSLWIIVERLIEGVQLTIVECTARTMTIEMSFTQRGTARKLLDHLLRKRQEIHAG